METSNEVKRIERIRQALSYLCVPGNVYELRCPKSGKLKTMAGYFDDFDAAAREAAEMSGRTQAVYCTLNPVNRNLLSRYCNRMQPYADYTSADRDIIRRLRLLIDTDAVREAGISSSDEEMKLAVGRIGEIDQFLREQGWPESLLAHSGNGGHLLHAIDLPNDQDSSDLVQNFLNALGVRFDDARVRVDKSVFNASRVSKLYGTAVCKGDNTDDRPHRYSRILKAPAQMTVVSADLIRRTTELLLPTPTAASSNGHVPSSNGQASSKGQASTPKQTRPKVQWMDDFLAKHNITVLTRKEHDGKWACRWEVGCPFCGEQDGAAALVLTAVGNYGYTCHHNRCQQPKRTWRDFRQHYEPNAEVLPQIITNGRQMRDVRRDALDALAAANEPPAYFVFAGKPARLHCPDGTPQFQVCDPDIMRSLLTEVADWYKTLAKKNDDGTPAKTAITPPLEVAREILAQPQWPCLPTVQAITRSPVFVNGGRLVCDTGYDPDSQLWVDSTLKLTISEKPSSDEIAAAKALLGELLHDFPFREPDDRANAISLLLLPYCRSLIGGPTPLYLVNAPRAGTGKDLLAQLSAILATGATVATKSECHDEREWRANLTSWLTRSFKTLGGLVERLPSFAPLSAIVQTAGTDDAGRQLIHPLEVRSVSLIAHH